MRGYHFPADQVWMSVLIVLQTDLLGELSQIIEILKVARGSVDSEPA